MAALGQKNKRCYKRHISESLLNCGNPNAYYRNVKFAVQRAKTIQQKNRGVAAFLFKFCVFNLHCSWCSCFRHKKITIAAIGPSSIIWTIKSDTVLPTAHYRCDVFFGTVLPRRWVAEMSPNDDTLPACSPYCPRSFNAERQARKL